MRGARLALLAVAALLVLPATAQARSLGLALISKGLKNPLFVTTAPGDSSRIFIVLKGGSIRILPWAAPERSQGATPTPFEAKRQARAAAKIGRSTRLNSSH